MAHGARQLRAETEAMDRVGERVGLRRRKVLIQIMHVHLRRGEALTGGDVEVADDLVDAEVAGDVAAFFAHGVETLRVVFAFALLDVLAFAEGPADAGVGFANVFAGLAAAGLGVGFVGGGGAVAVAAVAGVEVGGGVVVEVEGGCGDRPGFGEGGETREGDAVGDGGLLFAGDVHYVEGEELAGDVGEGYV